MSSELRTSPLNFRSVEHFGVNEQEIDCQCVAYQQQDVGKTETSCNISAESAIEWVVKQESDLGSEVSDRLNHGQAIPESLALKIVSQRIAALDIKHHGTYFSLKLIFVTRHFSLHIHVTNRAKFIV